MSHVSSRIVWAACAVVALVLCAAAAFAEDPGLGPFERRCAGCHGERGGGGMGPAIAGTALSAEAFSNIVRDGKGMMPATPPSDLGDEELADIYRMFARGGGGAPVPAAGLQALAGRILSRENVRAIAWVSIALMLVGTAAVAHWKYRNWSGLKFGGRYYRRLGVLLILNICLRTLFVDLLAVSSVMKKDLWRWLIHGMLLYGFLGLIAADILISIFNPGRAAMPLFSPFKLLANVSGLFVVCGLSVVVSRMLTDPYEKNGETFAGDVVFVAALFLVVLSGFAVEASRALGFFSSTAWVYLCHIVFVVLLFVSAPFTRFSHVASTFLLVLATRLSEEAAARGVDVGFREEPAPGRHHKSERIGRQVQSELFSGRAGEVRIRYYP